MQRRRFIKNSLSGIPILFTAPTILNSSCQDDNIIPTDKTVIIVGAGISGLAAAKKLHEKGFKVTVLESQDKIGGRLRTNRSLGIAFDEGASWIHGIDGNPITTLAQQAGMNTAFTDDESVKSYDIGGFLRPQNVYATTEDEFYTILNSLNKKGNSTQSFETVFNNLYPSKAKDRLWKFLLSTYVTFDTGDLDKLSSLHYNEGEEYGGIEKIATNGYDTITQFLAKDLNILLNQSVSEVDFTNTKIKIAHNGTVTEADYVLITVPLGVLKANTIQFVPALPSPKQIAIQKNRNELCK